MLVTNCNAFPVRRLREKMAKVNLKFLSRRARSLSPGASLQRKVDVPMKVKVCSVDVFSIKLNQLWIWNILTGRSKQQKTNLPAKITSIIGQRKALENYGYFK